MFPFSLFSNARKCSLAVGAVALMAVAQACGSDSSSSTSPHNNSNDVAPAKYVLRTVDGHSLPYQISRSPFFDAATGHFYNEYDVTVTGGAWDLDELGFADFYIDLSIKGDGVPMTQHKEAFGTYAVQGSQVIVTFNGAGSNALPLNNGQIQMPMDLLNRGVGNNYVFRR